MTGEPCTPPTDVQFQITDEPVTLSLRAHAAHRSSGVTEPMCPDVGRRLLLAETSFSDWVLRRVETVRFQDDRNVVREVTIELRVRDDAPRFGDADGEYWLVPLAVMWRRTLVDFTMTDEDGKAMTLPGLRLTQQLDQSILLAAAAAAGVPGAEVDAEVQRFVRRIVTGERADVEAAWKDFDGRTCASPALRDLREVAAFRQTAERLRGGFSTFVFLRCSAGRRRLLRLSFVEPVTWGYQQPTFAPVDDDGVQWRYEAGERRFHWSWLAAALGLTATRLRLQVPAAEHAGSYHLEVKAPPGVRIGEATLLAGRPGDPRGSFTKDHVRGSAQTVGLHGINVPTGSSCRAQLHMRVQTAGWLSVTTLATLGVLIGLIVALRHTDAETTDQIDNLVVLLLTGAAAAATFIAYREHGTVAARLVTLVRFSATASTALLVAAAVLITFMDDANRTGVTVALWFFAGLATLSSLHLVVVWFLSRRMEFRHGDLSPWDMAPGPDQERRQRGSLETPEAPEPLTQPPPDRHDVTRLFAEYRMDRPAIGIRSAEAWHRNFHRDDASSMTDMTDQLARGSRSCGSEFTCPRSTAGICRALQRPLSNGNGHVPAPSPA
jgi:hypothetical protein